MDTTLFQVQLDSRFKNTQIIDSRSYALTPQRSNICYSENQGLSYPQANSSKENVSIESTSLEIDEKHKARRRLFGSGDHSATRADLAALRQSLAELDRKRWNFNFEIGKPCGEGRYRWESAVGKENTAGEGCQNFKAIDLAAEKKIPKSPSKSVVSSLDSVADLENSPLKTVTSSKLAVHGSIRASPQKSLTSSVSASPRKPLGDNTELLLNQQNTTNGNASSPKPVQKSKSNVRKVSNNIYSYFTSSLYENNVDKLSDANKYDSTNEGIMVGQCQLAVDLSNCISENQNRKCEESAVKCKRKREHSVSDSPNKRSKSKLPKTVASSSRKSSHLINKVCDCTVNSGVLLKSKHLECSHSACIHQTSIDNINNSENFMENMVNIKLDNSIDNVMESVELAPYNVKSTVWGDASTSVLRFGNPRGTEGVNLGISGVKGPGVAPVVDGGATDSLFLPVVKPMTARTSRSQKKKMSVIASECHTLPEYFPVHKSRALLNSEMLKKAKRRLDL